MPFLTTNDEIFWGFKSPIAGFVTNSTKVSFMAISGGHVCNPEVKKYHISPRTFKSAVLRLNDLFRNRKVHN